METDQLIDRFFRVWTDEFTRAIEMFTGVPGVLKRSEINAEVERELENAEATLWWKQVFEGEGLFTTWIGAPEETWLALGSAMGGEGDEAKQIYLEMLGQAQQGAATVLSRGLPKPLLVQDGTTIQKIPSLAMLNGCQIAINLQGRDLSPIALAIDPIANAILALPARIEAPPPQESSARETSYAPMLERLMDLELPVSVALGRAVLPIQEVLKMTSGSLVELDRDVGEHVELLVHGTVVARGEVVSVKGNYGLRIREIISRQERMALHPSAAKQSV
jgi:flagellar motor switch protein FliN